MAWRGLSSVRMHNVAGPTPCVQERLLARLRVAKLSSMKNGTQKLEVRSMIVGVQYLAEDFGTPKIWFCLTSTLNYMHVPTIPIHCV